MPYDNRVAKVAKVKTDGWGRNTIKRMDATWARAAQLLISDFETKTTTKTWKESTATKNITTTQKVTQSGTFTEKHSADGTVTYTRMWRLTVTDTIKEKSKEGVVEWYYEESDED